MISIFRLTIVLIIGLGGCAVKKKGPQPVLAKNRSMGAVFYNLKVEPEAASLEPVTRSLVQAMSELYQSNPKVISEVSARSVRAPELFYAYGKARLDDIVTLSGELSRTSGTVKFLGGIGVYNGSQFRAVLDERLEVEAPNETFEPQFKAAILTVLATRFPNPNEYPRHNSGFYAEQLFEHARKVEAQGEEIATCEDVTERYATYRQSAELFEAAVSSGEFDTFGQQDRRFELGARLEEAKSKAQAMARCEEDRVKGFEMAVNFSGFSDENQLSIREALVQSDFEALLRKYTVKPATLSFRKVTDTVTFDLRIRFHDAHYRSTLKSRRTPEVQGGLRVLSLEHYFPLMKRMVVLQHSLPRTASPALLNSFRSMTMSLQLEKAIGDRVEFPVRGSMGDKQVASIFFPAELVVNVRGYDARTVRAKSEELLQNRGWIGLGACKSLDGSLTEDGLLYKFFGFGCD